MTDLERALWVMTGRMTAETLADEFAAVRAEALESAIRCCEAEVVEWPKAYQTATDSAVNCVTRIRALIPGGGRKVEG